MNRAVSYDEFCARCERQGRSHNTSAPSSTATIPKFAATATSTAREARWQATERGLTRQTNRIYELEQRLSAGLDDSSAGRDCAELYQLYGETFRAHKLKGIVMASSDA